METENVPLRRNGEICSQGWGWWVGIYSEMTYWVIIVSFIVNLTQPTTMWEDNLSEGLLHWVGLRGVVWIVTHTVGGPTLGLKPGLYEWRKWSLRSTESLPFWKALPRLLLQGNPSYCFSFYKSSGCLPSAFYLFQSGIIFQHFLVSESPSSPLPTYHQWGPP